MNQKLHQYFLNSIKDPAWAVDLDFKYIYANQSYKDFHSIKEDVLGKTFSEVVSKDLADIYIEDVYLVNKNKTNINFEEEYDNKIFECRSFPLLDENGEMIGVCGTIIDITDKKLMEKKLLYLSYTDSLTEVYNRACFEEKLDKLKTKNKLPIGVIMGDVNGLKLINDTFGHVEGDELLIQIAQVLKTVCQKEASIFRWGGDEFVVLVPNSDEKKCEKIINDIKIECARRKHNSIELSMSMGFAIMESFEQDIDDALKAAEEKVYKHKLLEQKSIFSGAINSLQESLEAKSFETKAHTSRMTKLVRKLGKNMNLGSSELDELEIATRLHDIGKIGIREEILLKPEKLTKEEYDIIKTHTEKGYRIVMASSGLESVAKTVLTHHERWDGEGYPLGLKKQEIPLTARIISVVDAFDAMTNNRIYRNALSKQGALDEIERLRGKQFDPEIAGIFLEMMENELNIE
ncbi:MAG: HD domain-containing phosphohydrolase [Proteocatella sp.]